MATGEEAVCGHRAVDTGGVLDIRDCVAADCSGVVGLVRPVLASYGFPLDEGAIARDLTEERAWVATLGGAILGCIVLRDAEGGTAELSRFYVRPESRRTGVGRRLYDRLELCALTLGVRTLHLASSRRFVEAHRFYVARGFRLVRSIDNEWEDDVFEKRLLPSSLPAVSA